MGANGETPAVARTNRLLTERWEDTIANLMLCAASQYVGPVGCSESGATYLTLYRGERTDVRTFVPNSSASLESAAATSRSLMSLQPFSPQIRTQNSSFAATVGAASAASVTNRTSATSLRLTPDVRSGRGTRSLAARSADSSRAVPLSWKPDRVDHCRVLAEPRHSPSVALISLSYGYDDRNDQQDDPCDRAATDEDQPARARRSASAG